MVVREPILRWQMRAQLAGFGPHYFDAVSKRRSVRPDVAVLPGSPKRRYSDQQDFVPIHPTGTTTPGRDGEDAFDIATSPNRPRELMTAAPSPRPKLASPVPNYRRTLESGHSASTCRWDDRTSRGQRAHTRAIGCATASDSVPSAASSEIDPADPRARPSMTSANTTDDLTYAAAHSGACRSLFASLRAGASTLRERGLPLPDGVGQVGHPG